eukprot:TRINITY_DN5926_c0_g1_i1.p1 TRINITY_DN5926_c0_g1~~TRINITY_DN5926_c0_g1_i1.p1  ORF type:complete len:412 (+),score=93.62 TRINITY_DN5926_c0_g1_i1:648-1883(+)
MSQPAKIATTGGSETFDHTSNQSKTHRTTVQTSPNISPTHYSPRRPECIQNEYLVLKSLLHSVVEQRKKLEERRVMKQLMSNSMFPWLRNESGMLTNSKYSAPLSKTYPRVSSYGVSSQMGVVPKRPNKLNQDAYFALENFMDIDNAYLFGIMDGHGHFGREVSTLVKSKLPANLALASTVCQKDRVRDLFLTDESFRESLVKAAYAKTNSELVTAGVDLSHSGTTSVTAFTCESLLLCANVGDSRAVIGSLEYQSTEHRWRANQITVDHKPDLEEEYKRIISFNGRVEPYKDATGKPLGPHRVWMKTKNSPGLAMSRSLGDIAASKVGVIAVPDIFELTIQNKHKILIIASDGIWGVLSNEQAIEIAGGYYEIGEANLACEALVRAATVEWKRQSEVIDDITVIVIFFNQ